MVFDGITCISYVAFELDEQPEQALGLRRIQEIAPDTSRYWKVVTWNISAVGDEYKSCQAPERWSGEEQVSAVVQEILRWAPDVISLQECEDEDALPGLLSKYALVSLAGPTHHGFVHLYVRSDLEAAVVEVPVVLLLVV